MNDYEDYTYRSLFADGLQLAASEEEGLSQRSTAELVANGKHLLAEFPDVAIIRGYVQGIAIILAQRADEEWDELSWRRDEVREVPA